MSLKGCTNTSPYMLTFGHDVVLNFEIVAQSQWVAKHNDFDNVDDNNAILIELETLDDERLRALDSIKAQKERVERYYILEFKFGIFV